MSGPAPANDESLLPRNFYCTSEANEFSQVYGSAIMYAAIPFPTRTELNVQHTTCPQHQYQQKQRRTEHQLLSFHLVTFNWSYGSAFQWWPSSPLTACHTATVPIGCALLARPRLTRILKCRLKASQIELLLAWTEDVH